MISFLQLFLIFVFLALCFAIVCFYLKEKLCKKVLLGIDTNHKELIEVINSSISPKFLELSASTNDLSALAVDIWRMEQKFLKWGDELSDKQKTSLDNSIQKIKRFLDKNDIEIIDYTDQKYNEGLNLEVLSVENAPNIKESRIKETVEPSIMHRGQVIKKAKIILLRSENV